MNYKDIGLSNTREMLQSALKFGYAVPAFNFNNMEQLLAIMAAANKSNSPVILQVSESAIKYMGADMMIAMVSAAVKSANAPVALNLDHGRSFDICKNAIDMGFSNVMIDASDLPFEQNVELSKQVAEYAHQFDVTAEAELGSLSGFEEDAASTENSHFTNPALAAEFVRLTGIDSLAVSIGTSHGAFKRTNPTDTLRFDILDKIAELMPDMPLVLHGASTVPEYLVDQINQYGGEILGACGIPRSQIRSAIKKNICKVNIDSDGRLAFTAAVRKSMAENPSVFDPRKYLTAAQNTMTELYLSEILDTMGSGKLNP